MLPPGITCVADTISTILPATLQSQTKAKVNLDYSKPSCTLSGIWHGMENDLQLHYFFIISNIKNGN